MTTQAVPEQDPEQRIRAAAARARDGGGGPLLPALHAVQAEFGHLPEPTEAVLAQEFNLSRADVHGVITFYRDFTSSPAGRPRLRICRAEACQAVGGEALLASARERLDADAVDEVFCLGNCALGPSASVDGRVLGRATVERLAAAVAVAAEVTP
jgi:formate dehydrogenase subunit gamma